MYFQVSLELDTQPANQPSIRSTTQWCLPGRSLLFYPSPGNAAESPRFLRSRLQCDSHTPCRLHVKFVGASARAVLQHTLIAGMASSSNSIESCLLASLIRTTGEISRASTMTRCLEHSFPLSVGGGPFPGTEGPGTDAPSMLARLQSYLVMFTKVTSMVWCSCWHTPAPLQSRRRRQQDLPLP